MEKLAGVKDLIVDSTSTATFRVADKAPTKEEIAEAFKPLKWAPGVDKYSSVTRAKAAGSFDLEIDGVG